MGIVHICFTYVDIQKSHVSVLMAIIQGLLLMVSTLEMCLGVFFDFWSYVKIALGYKVRRTVDWMYV